MSSSVFARRAGRALVFAFVLLLAAGAQAASAVTVRVDDDRADCPSAAFRSISAALKFVGPGSTVVVCHGRYVGSLVMDKPGVRLTGLTPNPADVIVLPAARDSGIAVVDMVAPSTTLANVTIRDRATASNPECPHALIAVDNGPGPFAQASVIDRVALRQTPACRATHRGWGIRIGSEAIGSGPGRAVVRDSTIVVDSQGIIVNAGSAAIRRNVIRAVSFGSVGVALNAGGARIKGNDVSRYEFGINAFSGDATVGALGQGNNVHHNRIGIFLGRFVRATVANNASHDNVESGISVGSVGAVVSTNRIDANGMDGIVVENQRFGPQPSGNRFIGNVASNNGFAEPNAEFLPADCWDQTFGNGTAGTANTWIGNIGATSIPRGICRPPGL